MIGRKVNVHFEENAKSGNECTYENTRMEICSIYETATDENNKTKFQNENI